MTTRHNGLRLCLAVIAVSLAACGSSSSDASTDTSLAETTSTTVPATSTTSAGPSEDSAAPTTAAGATDPAGEGATDGDQSDNGQETDGVVVDDSEAADGNVDLIERCLQGESIACYEVGKLGLPAPDGLITGNGYTQAPDADVIEDCNFQDIGEACYVAGNRGLELPEGP